jgi:polyhydroxyalkanoate synthesis regulator phasin
VDDAAPAERRTKETGMVLEGLRGYLQLASGLTDVTRDRARSTARALLAQGEAVVPDSMRVQVSAIADEIVATSKANRALMIGLVRAEVERAVSRMGLALSAELEAATARGQALEDRVYELERELRLSRAGSAAPRRSTAKKSTAKKSTAKKSTAKKSTAKKSTAKKSTAKAAASGSGPA